MCSYCGCNESVGVIARYMEEHVTVVNALGDVRRAVASGDSGAITTTCNALRAHLDPHTASEERGLFAELRKLDEFRDTIDGLCDEHVDIERSIDRVEQGLADAFPALERILMRHIDKEENGVFPAAIIALDGEGWDRAIAVA